MLNIFTNLLTFGWLIGNVVPLIYDELHDIYTNKGINFNSLHHLDDLGLVTFSGISGFQRKGMPKIIQVSYFGDQTRIKFNGENDNFIDTGKVLLTKVGEQLEPVCGPCPSNEFKQYVMGKWKEFGYVSS